MVEQLSTYGVEGIVLEATGGLERPVMSALESAGYPTRRVNPLQVRHFAKAAGTLAKTDRIDAGMITHFGESFKPPITLLPDAATREMQALVARRQQVVRMLTMEKNDGLFDPGGIGLPPSLNIQGGHRSCRRG